MDKSIAEALEQAKAMEQELRQRSDTDVNFDNYAANQAIPLCDTLSRLIRVVEVMEKALYSIEGERSYVESQSTGMRQYFRTECSYTAAEALDQARAILGGEG